MNYALNGYGEEENGIRNNVPVQTAAAGSHCNAMSL